MELTRNGHPRVVITGAGAITSVGNFQELGENLKNGVSGVKKLTNREGMDLSKIDIHISGFVDDFDPSEYIDRKEARRISRCSQFVIAATKIMLEDAGITEEELERDAARSGVMLGSGMGGFEMLVEATSKFHSGEKVRPSPFAIAGGLINMPTHHLSVTTKALGPILPIPSACAASTQALAHALDYIRMGRIDVAYVGGAEALVYDYVLAGFNAMRALASGYNDDPQSASRPFDKERCGFVFGEGVTIYSVETLEHALARDAKIYAELLGGGISSDIYHVTGMDPDAQGAFNSMNWALMDAHLSTEDIDYISAHGTSTPLNDRLETRAIKRLFGERAYEIPISSTKSMTGHVLGATGAIEAAAIIHMLDEQVVHPTINYEYPDPDCDLDYVPNEARDAKLQYVLSNSFGMGGHNASIVMGRFN